MYTDIEAKFSHFQVLVQCQIPVALSPYANELYSDYHIWQTICWL